MAKKLYVGNLPYTLTEETLKEAFAAVGNVVSVKIIVDTASGRSKGFGFVEMDTDKEAADAIEALNRTEVEGRTIVVFPARPRETRERRFGDR